MAWWCKSYIPYKTLSASVQCAAMQCEAAIPLPSDNGRLLKIVYSRRMPLEIWQRWNTQLTKNISNWPCLLQICSKRSTSPAFQRVSRNKGLKYKGDSNPHGLKGMSFHGILHYGYAIQYRCYRISLLSWGINHSLLLITEQECLF